MVESCNEAAERGETEAAEEGEEEEEVRYERSVSGKERGKGSQNLEYIYSLPVGSAAT